jgi:hypothetical protein
MTSPTSLPDALRPWREWLSWFDPELALQLGRLLQRLHPLMGPFRGHNLGGEPELEGLDDLRPRGSYEHLLASEWLLADEMPEEFLRRAASGEHMFLAPRPRAKRADRSVIALFDTGPLQLGAPRLAHLAIWILLARRARQSQAEFRWGSLQSPGELFEALTTENLKSLLSKRAFAPPDAVGLSGWRAALEAQRVGGERWVVGTSFEPSDWQVAPSFTHRVQLRKDLQGTALDVSLFERGNERGVHLPLPESHSAAPLLRGAFTREASPDHSASDPRAVALTRPPVIAIDGTRVGVALRDEPAALVFIVPRSAKHQSAAPRHMRWSSGYSALALSFFGKRLGVLLSDDRELRFWGTSLVMRPGPAQEKFHAPGSTAAWLPIAWLRAEKAQRLCVIDQSMRLLRWDSAYDGKRESSAGGALKLISDDVLGMVQINKNLLVFAHHEAGSAWFTRLGPAGDPFPARLFCKAPRDAAVLFGGRSCAVRVEQDPVETWSIGTWRESRVEMQAQLPGGSRAVGLMREPGRGRTSLITLDRNVLRLHFGGGGNELLYSAPDRIVSCVVCPNTSIVAMLTERRQFIVLSAVKREVCLNVQTARTSHASE